MPKISVVLPVYNAQDFIEDAVRSILTQTFSDFELIILDDCSTDGTSEILSRLSDPRIRIIQNNENLKVVKTLNKGFALARGEYIARMDADDISHPQRFEKQIAFLDANTEIDICGSWIQLIGKEDSILRPATEHEHIKVRLFFINPIFHPSVMIRAASFRKHNAGYDEHYQNAEDYGLWVKFIDVLRFANLPQVLLQYRIHEENVSVFKADNQEMLDGIHHGIYTQFLNKLGVQFTSRDLQMHRKLGMVRTGRLLPGELEPYLIWLRKLVVANNKKLYFNERYFRNVILSYLLYLSRQASSLLAGLYMIYKNFHQLYNFKDCAAFLLSRAKVKLRKAVKFN